MAPIRPKGNPFAALDLSDSEEGGTGAAVAAAVPSPAAAHVEQPADSKPRYRVWAETPEPTPTAVPFSKGRRSKVRHASDKEGWTSIQWNKPQFQEDSPESLSAASTPRPIEEDLVEAAPRTPEDMAREAKMWADRVKASLEKAEAAKQKHNQKPLTDDFIQSLSKLSFFRRAPTKAEDVVL